MRHLFTSATVATLLFSGSIAACGSDSSTFCDSARDFENTVREIDVNELASSLDEEFWAELLRNLDELIESESEVFGAELKSLRSEVELLIKRLEAVDYNLLAAAIDPTTAASYIAIATSLVMFVADSLLEEIESNC